MKKIIFISLLIFVTGCVSGFKGRPVKAVPDEVVMEDIAKTIAFTNIDACNKSPSVECRNRIIYATMLGIDINYHTFESKLFNIDRDVNFASTVATLAVNAAGAYTGTQVLATISSTIVGMQGAYNSEIMMNQLFSSIQNQMNAQRANVKTKIVKNLALPATEYTLLIAALDLEEYYVAGTLLSAINNISSNTATNAITANKILDNVSRLQ